MPAPADAGQSMQQASALQGKAERNAVKGPMVRSNTTLQWLYLVNASLLLTHEIDAAYWHEWDLFALPGGIQLFLVLNLLLVLLVLYGLRALAQRSPSGIVFSWILVAAGLFAATIHAYFLFSGDAAFRLPVSILLLVATFIVSSLQAVALLLARATGSATPAEKA